MFCKGEKNFDDTRESPLSEFMRMIHNVLHLRGARRTFTHLRRAQHGHVGLQRLRLSRLDSSIFFRARRDCIVNLSQVKQSRLSNDGGLIFLLKDGKEVVLSRRQPVLFRATRRSLIADFKLRRTSGRYAFGHRIDSFPLSMASRRA